MDLLEPIGSYTLLDFLTGLFSLIFVTVTILVGLKIASRYFKIKQRIFLYIGLGWAGICSAWYPSSISFVIFLITGGMILTEVPYFFIGNVILSLAALLYLMGVTEMIYKERQKIIIGIFASICIVFYIYFYFALFTAPGQIGIVNNFDAGYIGVVRYYLIFLMVFMFLATILLARVSLKSDDPEVKLRGKFIILYISFYLIGAFLDATEIASTSVIILVITRSILISASILFYFGFLMPKFIKKRFIKE